MTAKIEVDLELETKDAAKDAKKDLGKAGKESGEAFSEGFSSRLGKVAAAIAGVLAVSKGIELFKNSVSASAIQESAVNALNTQLAITGQFTQAVSNDLQNFASELQKTSQFGDEAVISQLAFAQAMGASAEQSKEVVSAAADLAASLNIDLNAATRNVAKTLGGYAGELGEVIPALKNLTTEQLQAGEGVKLLAKQFEGAASGRIVTYSGAIEQLKNAYGDYDEVTGNIITRSPSLIAAISTTTKVLAQITDKLKISTGGADPFKPILLGAITVARFINRSLIPQFRILSGVIQTVFGAGKVAVKAFFQIITEGFGFIGDILNKLGIAEKFAATLKLDRKEGRESLKQDIDAIFSDLISPEDTEKFTSSVDGILDQYEKAINKAKEFQVANKKAFGDTGKSVDKSAQAIGKSLNQTLGNGVANGIQTITTALANGDNAFKAFGAAVVTLVGDLAIQMGKIFVATGIAQLSLFSSPGASILAGAALIAAGTLAKSIFGGGGGGASSAAGIPGGIENNVAGDAGGDQIFQPTEEREEASTRVSVNIQGDVLDSDETGLRIAKILENASLNENVRIVGAFA
jgi:hypothetical protein